MEKKQPKTCEEYVLNVLAQTEVELADTKKELQETQKELEIEVAMHKELLDLVIAACEGGYITVEKGDVISFTHIYLKSGYIGSYVDESTEDTYLVALKELIELVNAIPKREE